MTGANGNRANSCVPAEREHFARISRQMVLRKMAPDQCLRTRFWHALILWSWCGPIVSDAVVLKDPEGFILHDHAGRPIPAKLADLGELLGIPPKNRSMLTRMAGALEEQKLLRFDERKVMYVVPKPSAFETPESTKNVDLQVNKWHFGFVDLQVNNLPIEPAARARALAWINEQHATFKNERNQFLARWAELIRKGAPALGILIDKEKKRLREEESAGGRSSSVTNSAPVPALIVRPPAPPPSIKQTLKTWLVGRFKVPTHLDDQIFGEIAQYIPDLAAFEQFKLACEDAIPKKWSLFVTIARDCAENRPVYTKAAGAGAPKSKVSKLDEVKALAMKKLARDGHL